MKRLCKHLLCLTVMMCCLFGISIDAQAASESDLTFTLNSDGESYSVTDCNTSASGELVIPSTYNGKPVTVIGEKAFSESSLTSITIPDSVIIIDEYAFYACENLSTVTIGNGVTTIGDSAFAWCSSLITVNIPDSVDTIGYSAFEGCSSLISVTFPNGLKEIKGRAFGWCYSLFTVSIPDSVTTLGPGAFRGCTSLFSVTLGAGISCIDGADMWYGGTFQDCTSLTSITIPENVTSIGYGAFSCCTSLTTINIPDSVTSIDDYAFKECESLTVVTLGSGITSIGNYAFSNCDSIVKINIPNSVTAIGNYAFHDSDNLLSVSLGNSVNEIGDYAFSSCNSLASMAIPDSVTSVGGYVFSDCAALNWVTIGDGVISIGQYAFKGCSSLTRVSIGDGLTSIRDYTFQNCTNLVSVSIGKSVTTIGSSAFDSCSSLSSIVIPGNVTSIGSSAFYNCSALKTLTINDGVTSIGNYAFRGCSSLTVITIPDSVATIGTHAFRNCTALICATIGDGVSSVGNYAFAQCDNLTAVFLGNSVMSIGQNAFYECEKLCAVSIPEAIISIGKNVFYDCASLSHIAYAGTQAQWENVSVGSSNEYLTSAANFHYETAFELTDNCVKTDVYCPVCAENVIAITKTGGAHSKNADTAIITPPTCTEEGYTTYTCSVCNDIYNTDYTDALGHTEIVDAAVAATCIATGLTEGSHCAGCGEVFVAQEEIPTLSHNYETDGENDGCITYTCTLCGDTFTETVDLSVGKVDHWNIVLEDNYAVNFYLQISESIESTAKARLVIGNNIATYKVSDLEKTEEGYFLLPANISAAQMNDIIVVMILNGTDVSSIGTYNARQYCDTILADDSYSQYHALVKEMLNYGAMAQMYFDYDTGYLANEGITGTANTEVPETTADMTYSGAVEGLNFYGASLVYRERIAVRYYFTGDVTGLSFTTNGNTYTPVAKDDMYYIEVADILPQDLDQQIALTVTNANGDVLTITYGPMNYIIRMNAKGSEALKNLLKALYNYHMAAKALTA